MHKLLIVLALCGLAFAQRGNRNEDDEDYFEDDYTSEELADEEFYCEDLYGHYPHREYCDKYWTCHNGTAKLKECGNGLMFDKTDTRIESCNYDYIVDCGDRLKKAEPISTNHCDWLYGVFPDVDDCTIFWSCWGGRASKYQCAAGLGYDSKNRICTWANEIDLCEANSNTNDTDGFVCPPVDDSIQSPGHYPRYPHPTDCRRFFVCISGKPRDLGCERGQVFSSGDLRCKRPKHVPGCEDYYKKEKKDSTENSAEEDDEFYDYEEEDF